MIRLALLISTLMLCGCGLVAPKMQITKAGGEVIRVAHPKPLQDRLYADGSRMNWVDVATYKSMGALPPPARRQPVWQCLAADYGTTALGIANFGLMEANPIGWPAVIPLGIAHTVMVQRAERKGDARPAKFASWLHCAAATWNAALILAVLL